MFLTLVILYKYLDDCRYEGNLKPAIRKAALPVYDSTRFIFEITGTTNRSPTTITKTVIDKLFHIPEEPERLFLNGIHVVPTMIEAGSTSNTFSIILRSR